MDPGPVLARVDRTEYPWTPKRVTVDGDGNKMAYLDEGSGPAVLMLHGNPTWSYLYRNVVKGLSDSARCVAPDHIGFGCSDKPRDPLYHTLERHIRNLTAFVREAGLDDVTLVCHDWGGPIGLGWAVRNPQRVKRVVLLNTWAMRPDGLVKIPWAFKAVRSPGVGEILIQKHNLIVEKGIPMGIVDKDKVTARLMEAYRAPFPFPDDRVGLLRFIRMVPARAGDEGYETFGEIEAGLRDLDVPVEAYWARRDFAFPKRIAHRFMELMPQGDAARITDVPDASHFLQEEAHETIVAAIRRGLDQDAKGA